MEKGNENMEKSYLHLEGRAPEDVKRELGAFYLAVERLASLPKDDPQYKMIFNDMSDRMRGFKNYFSQDLDAIIEDIKRG